MKTIEKIKSFFAIVTFLIGMFLVWYVFPVVCWHFIFKALGR